MNQIVRFLTALALVASLTGCSRLLGINLNIVGEKTSLERQVLGTYEELGTDLAVYASVRGVQPDGSLAAPTPMTESQRAVLQAINNRRYNRDDLDAILLSGAVGEGNDGLLVARENPTGPAVALKPELVAQIVDEENRDRQTIIGRLMATTPGVSEGNRGDVGWVFAGLNQDLAPTGSAIQARDGSWSVK